MSGHVVRRGAIRIDATRAAWKVRDHLLAEPEAWLSEVLRAAKLSRATRVDIAHDADDLHITWDGDPWATETLGALETHVFSEGAVDRRAHLLALGVFAALGHEAKWIEVFARDAAGEIFACRYDRKELDAAGADATNGRSHAPPRHQGARHAPPENVLAIALHVKRGPSFAVLARFLTHGEPPEVALLRERLSSEAVPVYRDGAPIPTPPRSEALVSIEVDGVDPAALEVIPDHTHPPEIEFFELGVWLATVPWPDSWLSRATNGLVAPFRVVVQAPRLPTNVSRSVVHADAIARVVSAATRALPRAIEAIEKAAAVNPSVALEDAVGAFAAVRCFAELTASTETDPLAATLLERLLSSPLLADPTGRPRPVRDGLTRAPMFIYRGSASLDPTLGPLLPDVFWDRRRAVDALLRGDDYASIEADVRAGAARVAAVARMPPRPVAVPRAADHFASRRREEDDGFVAEVALRWSEARGPSTTRVWIQGQPFQTLSHGEGDSNAPIYDAAVAWPTGVFPDRRYERLSGWSRRDEIKRRVDRLAIELLAREAPRLAAERAAYLRTTLARVPDLVFDPRFSKLEIWPLQDGRIVTTEWALERAAAAGGLRFVRSPEATQTREQNLPPAILFILDPPEERALAVSADGAPLVQVYYTPWLVLGPGTAETTERALAELAPEATPVVVHTESDIITAATFAETPGSLYVHRGRVVARALGPRVEGGLALAIESDALLPGAKFEVPVGLISRVERAVVEAFMGAMEAGLDLASRPGARAQLIHSALQLVRAPEIVERLRRIALFDLVSSGMRSLVSAIGLEASFESAIRMTTDIDAGGTFVVGGSDERALVSALTHAAVVDHRTAALPPLDSRKTALAALHRLEHMPAAADKPAAHRHRPAPREGGRASEDVLLGGTRRTPESMDHALGERTRAPEASYFFDALSRLYLTAEDSPWAPSITRRIAATSSRLAIPSATRLQLCDDGPPVVFDRTKDITFVRASHPDVALLVAAGDAVSLVAAVVAEIDLALDRVTAADEWAALVALLEILADDQASAPSTGGESTPLSRDGRNDI